ncbi:hypothetical protein AgCh_003677 [Apium graveolens]
MGPLHRLDSMELNRESLNSRNLASLKMANIEVSNPSLVKGLIPTWTRPIWIWEKQKILFQEELVAEATELLDYHEILEEVGENVVVVMISADGSWKAATESNDQSGHNTSIDVPEVLSQ